MANVRKLWRICPPNILLRQHLSQELGISPITAQILINRGLADEAEAKAFLHGGAENLLDPFLLKDMQIAVTRIQQAIASAEKITIYGDYDVDGITASALMYKVLQRFGATVDYYIPERQTEGYGLNSSALEYLVKNGTKLLVTVDCGIGAVTEVSNYAPFFDIIITDHHQPPALLPSAFAIINPKQQGCDYPNKNLAGVGVAFKLCQALWQQYYPKAALLTEYVDLVALGTIADIVPLVGENRSIAKLGLAQLAASTNVGLQALLTVCGLNNRKISSGQVGFVLAPRLNAAGRIKRAAIGVELLTTQDETRARQLALILDGENQERQAIEKEILNAAEKMIVVKNLDSAKVLVLSGENWHPGVIGIVASRLVEKYFRPVIIISVHDGVGKGSCRSIPKFDMYDALSHCQNVLIQFGGHHQAAGLSILPDNIPALERGLTSYAAANLSEQDYHPVLNIDSVVAMQEINSALLEELACLEPHGMGNPGPVFMCQNLALASVRPIGNNGQHLKLRVKSRGKLGDVIGWNMGGYSSALSNTSRIDLAFLPEFHEWGGQKGIQLKAHDLRKTQQEQNSQEQFPGRMLVAQVYLILKKTILPATSANLSISQISNKLQTCFKVETSPASIYWGLQVLAELDLITLAGGESDIGISMKKCPEKKLDINTSPTFAAGRRQNCADQED